MLLLKHKIFELCINILFDSVTNQFSVPSFEHEFKIGEKYSKLDFKVVNSDGTTRFIQYRGCTIVDAFKFLPTLKQTITFEATCCLESVYLPDLSITFDILYNCKDMLGTNWLTSYER